MVPDDGDRFLGIEGFREVGVDAEAQPGQAVHTIVLRRQKDDRQELGARMRAQAEREEYGQEPCGGPCAPSTREQPLNPVQELLESVQNHRGGLCAFPRGGYMRRVTTGMKRNVAAMFVAKIVTAANSMTAETGSQAHAFDT